MLRTCIILLAVFFLTANGTAQTHVATTTRFLNSSTSTISRAFASASVSGNLIVVHLSWDNQSRSVSSVTDNKGNSYSRIHGPTNWHTNYRSELWYAYNITGGGSPINITATLTGSSTSYFQMYMSEYSGILSTSDPLDQDAVRVGNTAAVNSGSRTTLYANELIYGVSIGASGTLTAGATFTLRSSANANIVQDKPGSLTGSYTANFTSAGGNWVAEMATFRSAAVAPVELLDFDVHLTDQQLVEIKWTTATERNNDHFNLERSNDGIEWKTIKEIKGAGNSSDQIHYSVTDAEPLAGQNLYRLTQVDIDGRTKTYQIRKVNVTELAGKFRIYPNPARDLVHIEGDLSDLKKIMVFNGSGQTVTQNISINNTNSRTVTINIGKLLPGIYVVKTIKGYGILLKN